MQPVEGRNAEIVLTICCQHLAGTMSGANTLVLREAPQALLGLKTLCARAADCAEIFSWIRSMMYRRWSAHIEVYCCEDCANSSSLDLDQYHETFEIRCTTIQQLLPYLCKRLGTVTCAVGKKEIATEDGTISGVRSAIQLLNGGNFTFVKAANS